MKVTTRARGGDVKPSQMIIRRAYKFRLKTTPEIENRMLQFAGCSRFVWNFALAAQKERLDKTKKVLSYFQLCKCLTQWKKEEDMAFLAVAPAHSLQQTLKALDRAMKDAFDKKQPAKRFPVWKKKFKCVDSFRYPAGIKLQGARVYLPKLGWVRFHKSREIQGTVRNATVSRKGEHWFVSIQTQQEVVVPPRLVSNPDSDIVGIDVGIARFVTTSTGEAVSPLSSFKKLEKKMALAQKLLARKKKFSKNWQKQKRRVSKVHIKIADARKDFLQKKSTIMSKKHAVIVAEDLSIKNMSASAKGDMEKPGKNVKAKAGLNRSILDQGWGNFFRMLEYKQQWSGGSFLQVDPKNTSRKCPRCDQVSIDNRKTQVLFLCITCGFSANADYVGAVNIKHRGIENLKAAGQAASACGGRASAPQ